MAWIPADSLEKKGSFAGMTPVVGFLTLGVYRNAIMQYFDGAGIAASSLLSRQLCRDVEDWCRARALPAAVSAHEADIAFIRAHPQGRAASFQVFISFLDALQRLPLDNPVLHLHTWRTRLAAAKKPRPRRFGQRGNVERGADRFDWGYPGGYWSDAFGTGGPPNDYVREVGGAPTWTAVCIAGSDGGQYHRWDDKPKPAIAEGERRSFIQTMQPTAWDAKFLYWQACAAELQMMNL